MFIKIFKEPTEKEINDDIKLLNYATLHHQLAFIRKNPEFIKFIKTPLEAVQLEAVNQDGLIIRYISSPTTKVKHHAVNQNPFSIAFIENPSEQLQHEAISSTEGKAALFIKKIDERFGAYSKYEGVGWRCVSELGYGDVELEIILRNIS